MTSALSLCFIHSFAYSLIRAFSHSLILSFYSYLIQFSDGVGYGWIDSLRDHADKNVSDLMFQNAVFRFPENTPVSKEAYYYRSIFEEHYPQVSQST